MAQEQPLIPETLDRISEGAVPEVREVALRHQSECPDGRQCTALGTVHLVEVVSIPNYLPLLADGQAEIAEEHVAAVIVGIARSIARRTTATVIAAPGLTAVARFGISRVISVPHALLQTATH